MNSKIINAQCPSSYIQVGSNVGIPTLSSALNSNLFPTNGGGGAVVTNFCVSGNFNLDTERSFQCNIHILSNSKLLKNGSSNPSGNSFSNCTISGNAGSQIDIVGSGGQLTYILFSGCNISGVRMKAENNGNFSFGSNTTLTDVGLVEGVNNGKIASFGATFLRSPIKVTNGGFFFDNGSSTLEANVGPTSYNVLLINGARILGGNNSTYKKGGNANVICENCGPSFIESATITSGRTGIYITNSTSEFIVEKCTFSFAQNGIEVSNSGNVIVEGCTLSQVTRLINSHMGTNIILNRNSSTTGGPATNFYMSSNAEIFKNDLGSNTVRFHDDIRFIENKIFGSISLSDMTNAIVTGNNALGYFEDRSSITKYNCNTAEFGMDFTGSPFTEIRENFILNDEIFMNCSFNDQVNHGNKFSSGTQLRGGANYGEGTFFVANTPQEFPTHSPDEIMDNTGTTSTTCTQGIPPNFGSDEGFCSPKNIIYLKNLINQLLKCRQESNLNKGVCTKNLSLIKKLLKLCPKLMEDIAFRNLVNSQMPETYKSLPDVHDVMRNINTNHSTTSVNSLKNQMTNLTGIASDIFALSGWVETDNVSSEQTKSIRFEKIAQILNEIHTIQSTESFIDNYKNALIWYLEYNRDFYASQARKLQIKALAENCDEYDSPSQKLAGALCKHLEIDYIEGACNELRQVKAEENDSPKVYPNPVTNILMIENALGKDVEIINLAGKTMFNEAKLNTKEIDVSNIENGIYFIKINDVDTQHTLKFIKID